MQIDSTRKTKLTWCQAVWSKLLRVVGGLEHRRFLPWSCDQIIPLLHWFFFFSTKQPLLITKRYMIVNRCKERLQPITPQPPSVSLHKTTPQFWQFLYTGSFNPFCCPYCSYTILKYRIGWCFMVDAMYSTSLPTVCKLPGEFTPYILHTRAFKT
jgi:hypothetical protein